jgi:hypothetical protein
MALVLDGLAVGDGAAELAFLRGVGSCFLGVTDRHRTRCPECYGGSGTACWPAEA